MSKYRKIPVEIEAFRLGYEKAPDWFKENKNIELKREKIIDDCNFKEVNGITEIYINTLEGKMKANDGDYIIKGIAGEIYPCKPEIFEKIYEKVDDEKEKFKKIEFSIRMLHFHNYITSYQFEIMMKKLSEEFKK